VVKSSWMRVTFEALEKEKEDEGQQEKLRCLGSQEGWKSLHTSILDAKTETLMPIIRQKIKPPDNIVYTDCWRAYNALDVSKFKHYRLNHSKIFAQKHNHINGIENFWN